MSLLARNLIQGTLLIILTLRKKSPGGTPNMKKIKTNLKLQISLLLVRPQDAQGRLQIQKTQENLILWVWNATIKF